MTDLDYIRATHLARVRIMQHVLRELLAGHDGVIIEEDKRAVGEQLGIWADELFARIDTEPGVK